jgi:flavin reductase (DIM6/NTAB) family NADH-FMN oxidoreductase RutF
MSTHADFKKVEASRPPASPPGFRYTQTTQPEWTFGSGANTPHAQTHVCIDPYAPDRPAGLNYKLLISSVVPRPIAFLSTLSGDGAPNLAPFSYFNMVHHDPPMFVVGFSSPVAAAKDSLRNLLETGECVINIISDSFVEAANSTCIDAPPRASEWEVSGLTAEACDVVACARVKEAVFSVEARLEMVREWESRSSGTKTGTMVVLEGLRFWVREDAINEERSMVDPEVSDYLSICTHAYTIARKLGPADIDLAAGSETNWSHGRHYLQPD